VKGIEQSVENATFQHLLFYTKQPGNTQSESRTTFQGDTNLSHTLLEELVADKDALEHFHRCAEIEREGYLCLFREFLLVKEKIPHVVARLPEKKSLNDLCFWQQLGWILGEHKYMGWPLDGLVELPPDQRERAALMSCETIVARMAEQGLPFHVIMVRWSELFAKVRRFLQEEEQLAAGKAWIGKRTVSSAA
jgi:hypothetical protein